MIKILILFLSFMLFSFANETEQADSISIESKDVKSVETGGDTSEDLILNADEKLKDDIITFDRLEHVDSNVSDPFIYVYPKTEQELEEIIKIRDAKLVLNGIFENRAKINNKWVQPEVFCKNKDSNDKGIPCEIDGWIVSGIKGNVVELKFKTHKKSLDYSQASKVKMKYTQDDKDIKDKDIK